MQEIGQVANNLVNAGIAMMPVVGAIVVFALIAIITVFAMAFGTMRNKGCRYGADVPIECRARYGGVPICPKESAVEEAPRVIERLTAEVERLQAQLSEEKKESEASK